ncbi:unnamed protein product [Peniophora sp. CBMAI 1063]|nr:unnamed protein product [Peniophora sp. CBMAI 1063]
MSVYAFELPTTGSFSFADCFSDLTGTHTSALAEATQARASLRGLLKESKRTDGDKDYLRLVKTLEEYIPYLYGVVACVQAGELSERGRPVFSWRTTLSSTFMHSSPRLSLPGLASEQAFTLLTYAFALSNLARLNVGALGAYERARGLSDAERKAKDEKLQFAVTLLCKAAGVFAHVSEVVLVQAEKDPGWLNGVERPPELSKEVASALSKLSLAAAQSLAARKLLTKAAADLAVAPGPPLPKSHPKPALLAMLHLDAAALCSGALALLRIPGASRARLKPPMKASTSSFKAKFGRSKSSGVEKGDDGEDDAPSASGSGREPDVASVASDLLRFAGDSAAHHTALSHKWLGVDAGEAGGDRAGAAVGFLLWSRKELEEIKDSAGAAGKDEGKDGRKSRKEKVLEELEAVGGFLRHYKKMNDSLSFKPVPSQSDLQAFIPAGRMAVAVRPYTPPTPEFGPGSVEYTRRQAEALELEGGGESADASPPLDKGTYLGAGSYF